jgi:hypothetical protein
MTARKAATERGPIVGLEVPDGASLLDADLLARATRPGHGERHRTD